ncbi:MAG: TrbC/VirB2 family protein [bacterium]|nr:TrbC/VirB2 family protein [bacterium]
MTDGLNHFGKRKIIFTSFLLITILFLPLLVGAQTTPIPNPLKCEDIECVVQTIADLIAGLVTVIGTIMIIIGGIQYITSAGNEDKAKRAKNTVLYAIIGIAIAVSASFIIGFLREILSSSGD